MALNIIVICAMIISSLILVLCIFCDDRVHSTWNWLMAKDEKWSFKDWADPLVSMAAVLGLILALIQNNKHPLIAGLNLICSAIIIIIPITHKALFKPNSTPVWAFLTFATITFVTVTVELGNAIMLADDDIIHSIPASTLVAFRIILALGILFAFIYSIRSIKQTIEVQAKEPANHVSHSINISRYFPKFLVSLHVRDTLQNTAKTSHLIS